MEELEKVPGADLVPYEPGLPLETTIRASLVRFRPGSVISLAAVFAFLGMVPGPGEWLEAMAMFGAGVGALTGGFAVGLEALRRWLYPDAKVCGRRSFVAGLMAPAAFFAAGVFVGPFTSGLGLLGLMFLVALSTAVLMFFAWLTPTPEEMRDSEYQSDGELLDVLGS